MAADSGEPKVLGPAPEEVIVPEVVTPAFPKCPGCCRGTPHRDEQGRIGAGHSMNPGGGRPKGSKNRTTLLAIREMQRHTVKAVRAVIRCLEDPNPWVVMAAAGRILEHTLPKPGTQDLGDGPLIVFPEGTKIDLLARPALPPAVLKEIVEAKQRIPDALVPARIRASVAKITERVPAAGESHE